MFTGKLLDHSDAVLNVLFKVNQESVSEGALFNFFMEPRKISMLFRQYLSPIWRSTRKYAAAHAHQFCCAVRRGYSFIQNCSDLWKLK